MKKVSILVTAMLLTSICSLQAQTSKGSFMLGLHNFSPQLTQANSLLAPTNALGISFGTMKSEAGGEESKASYSSIGLSGSGHYFVIDNLSVGLNLNVLSQKIKDQSQGAGDEEYKVSLFIAGPELRYYIPAGAKSKIYVSGSGAVGSIKTPAFGQDENDTTKLSRFGGGAGLAIFPSQHFSIDVGLGYGAFITKDTYNFGGEVIESKDTNSGISLDVGFSVFF